jgi:HlyD family type I secretion membrane fusion protein
MTSNDNLDRRLAALRERLQTNTNWRQHRAKAAPRQASENPSSATQSGLFVTRWLVAGWVCIGVFLGGGLFWASESQIDAAAIALGTVTVESHRKTIAHVDGGVVNEILVREGDFVEKGQPLIRMDPTHANATYDLLESRERSLLARLARLDAERSGALIIEFSHALLDQADEISVLNLMDSEMQILETRQNSLTRQENILSERIRKQRSQISGIERRRTALAKREALLIEEFEMMSKLVRDGLIAKNRVLAIDRRIADAEADVHELDAQISTAHDEIAKLELEQLLLREKHLSEVAKETQNTNERLSEVREQLRAATNVQNRAVVRAPESGVIIDLHLHTAGGVLQPGETILELVPDSNRYVFDLRINPDDIDVVYTGQPARIRLSAYNARTTPQLDGKLVHVSADRLTDPGTGAHYFSGRVIPSSYGIDQQPTLVPGMHADVYLVTAERSVLDFILDPIIRTTEKAAREL